MAERHLLLLLTRMDGPGRDLKLALEEVYGLVVHGAASGFADLCAPYSMSTTLLSASTRNGARSACLGTPRPVGHGPDLGHVFRQRNRPVPKTQKPICATAQWTLPTRGCVQVTLHQAKASG